MNPYENLPATAFWRSAVTEKNVFRISDGLWNPKFSIRLSDNVVTYGSCFAQHIGNALAENGLAWFNAEPAPAPMSRAQANQFGYGIFSARTGNIYTTSLLKQWVEWSLGICTPPAEYWVQGDRIFDPFRPRIEPDGFGSIEEMRQSRHQAILSFRKSLTEAKYFVFTLGLTEGWKHVGGYEYPMCPGTAAGTFSGAEHLFFNHGYPEAMDHLSQAIDLIRTVNPSIQFILTVSPVPLTATNSERHVLVATTASKSILRAVADRLCRDSTYIDYFPAYEIIVSPAFKGIFFEPNQRNVSLYGVNFVMDCFFTCMLGKFPEPASIEKGVGAASSEIPISSLSGDDHCDEALLAAFEKKE